MVESAAIALLHHPKGRVDNESEVEIDLDGQTRPGGLPRHFATSVSTLMMEEPVVIVVEVRRRRDDEDGGAAGAQNAMDLLQRAHVVGYVFEQVDAQHGVGAG